VTRFPATLLDSAVQHRNRRRETDVIRPPWEEARCPRHWRAARGQNVARARADRYARLALGDLAGTRQDADLCIARRVMSTCRRTAGHAGFAELGVEGRRRTRSSSQRCRSVWPGELRCVWADVAANRENIIERRDLHGICRVPPLQSRQGSAGFEDAAVRPTRAVEEVKCWRSEIGRAASHRENKKNRDLEHGYGGLANSSWFQRVGWHGVPADPVFLAVTMRGPGVGEMASKAFEKHVAKYCPRIWCSRAVNLSRPTRTLSDGAAAS